MISIFCTRNSYKRAEAFVHITNTNTHTHLQYKNSFYCSRDVCRSEWALPKRKEKNSTTVFKSNRLWMFGVYLLELNLNRRDCTVPTRSTQFTLGAHNYRRIAQTSENRNFSDAAIYSTDKKRKKKQQIYIYTNLYAVWHKTKREKLEPNQERVESTEQKCFMCSLNGPIKK